VGPEAGQLACGEVGPGRLIETHAILEAAAVLLRTDKDLSGKTVLVTSGANHEPVDPVRYIGNRSSGRMGRALALEALQRGAKVIVVSGPAETPLPEAAEIIPVQTAQEMFDAVRKHWEQADIFIGAAAVADYHVENPAKEKHKRNGTDLTLTLKPNPDIAAYVGAHKREGQIVVGFAAETSDMLAHAAEKLEKKKLDLIVANPVGGENSTIGSDISSAWLLRPNAQPEEMGCLDKAQLAQHIFDAIVSVKPSVDSPRIFR
jgi:phosphopantothenoylcysteine decarboxylase/phosphopantothenate--cysteine ligase